MTEYSWDDMRFFLALARDGQLTRAARQLGTAHVTVARRVERLEAALSQRLFERNPRGYELTSTGRRLIEVAERMEAASEGAVQGGAEGLGVSGTLRLAVPEGFGSFFSEQLLSEFVTRFPRISLELITMTQVISLSRREADLSVTVDPVAKGPYESQHLAEYDLRLYASRAYLASHPAIRDRDDLLSHHFIGYIEGMIFSPGLDYLDEVHHAIRPTLKSSSIFNQLSATRRGLGLCVLPCYLASGFNDLQLVMGDTVVLRRSYWLTCHRDTRQMRRERMVSNWLVGELKSRQGMFSSA